MTARWTEEELAAYQRRRATQTTEHTPPPMTEKELQAAVLEIARIHGWRHYHTYDSRRSPAGFPDLVLVRDDRLIFAELKREGEDPTEAQEDWLEDLDRANAVETAVWRPADLPDTINKELT